MQTIKARAVAVFHVAHGGGIKLRVRVLPTVRDVHREYQALPGDRMRSGKIVHAFVRNHTCYTHSNLTATIVLPLQGGDLDELIPHEVVHAVMLYIGGATFDNDEQLATSVGIISSRIRRRIRRLEA